ncbi:hypothetical protein GCM10027296_06930 [Chitinimonas naiadis]
MGSANVPAASEAANRIRINFMAISAQYRAKRPMIAVAPAAGESSLLRACPGGAGRLQIVAQAIPGHA